MAKTPFKPATPEELKERRKEWLKETRPRIKKFKAWKDRIDGIPDYLRGEQKLKSFLCSSLFYPCAGQDSEPISLMQNKVSRFVYVDYGMEQYDIDEFLRTFALEHHMQIRINTFTPESLFGMNWVELREKHADDIPIVAPYRPFLKDKKIFAASCVGKRNKAGHQKKLNIIYIPFEGVIAFRELYLNRSISPKVLAYIDPHELNTHLLFGAMENNQAGLPKYILTRANDFRGQPQIGIRYEHCRSLGYLQLYRRK